MTQVTLNEYDVKNAHKFGCKEVRETLELLFPGLELGLPKQQKYYKPEELTVKVERGGAGCYLVIRGPNGLIAGSDLECKKDGEYIWIPFLARRFIVTKDRNFEVLKT